MKLVLFTVFIYFIFVESFMIPVYARRTSLSRSRSKNTGRSYSRGRSQTIEKNFGNKPDIRHEPVPGPIRPTGTSFHNVQSEKIVQSQQNVPNQKPIGWNVNNNNNHQGGAPPPYPGLGHNPVPANGAPPAYSPSQKFPPSYAASVGQETYGSRYPHTASNIGKIAPRGQTNYDGKLGTGPVFQGLGPNTYGAPSYAGAHYPYTNGLSSAGNTGLYSQQAVGGIGGGSYGSTYGYGSNSNSPFSFGNVLTSIALWNLGSSFNSYRPHQVHIHDNREPNIQPTIEVTTIKSTPIMPPSTSELSTITPINNFTESSIRNDNTTPTVIVPTPSMKIITNKLSDTTESTTVIRS